MSIPTVLVLPYPVQGHVNPLMNLSQKLVEHGCKVIFVNTEFTHKKVVNSMAGQQDSLNDSQIKLVSIPDGLEPEDDRTNFGKMSETILNTMPSMLEKLIEDIHLSGDDKISCIVADLCMGWALEVGNKLGIKVSMFWPASAAIFSLLISIPKLMDDGILDSHGFPITEKTFKISPSLLEMDTRAFIWLSTGDTVAAKKIFNYLMRCTQSSNFTKWWLCNTTYELEAGPLSFVPNLLPVGPLLRSYDNNATTKSIGQFWEEDLSCINWLDRQPHCSVLYVAFGSFTFFDQNQFDELAFGLERTNRPFLWVVRQDSNCANKIVFPNEFLGSQGKIVGWAPQQKVLSHPSIACFLSHCGWNSTMEGLSNGVPFLCWPYFSDQFYNMTFICEELKVGLGLNSDENGLVQCGEIKMKLDQLLNDGSIRSRSIELKEKVLSNLVEGVGQSSKGFNKFVMWLKE